jgi:hypothetical protein
MKQVTITIPEMKDVEFEIICSPEDMQIEGNASAIDEETDRQIVNNIISQLNDGNEWAWCSVNVKAKWKGLEGNDYLGGCSYESEKDFIVNSGYYQDMKQIAYDDLISNLEDLND